MRTRPAAALAFTVLFVASAARAETPEVRGTTFGIAGGPAWPEGVARETYLTGFAGEAFIAQDLGHSPLALRGEFLYRNFALQKAAIPPEALPGGGTGTLLGVAADLQWNLMRGPVRPYLLFGGGGYAVKAEYDATQVPSSRKVRPGGRAGGGITMSLGGLLVFAQAVYEHVLPASGEPSATRLENIPLTIGVLF